MVPSLFVQGFFSTVTQRAISWINRALKFFQKGPCLLAAEASDEEAFSC